MSMQPRLEEPQLAAWRVFLRAHATVIDAIERDLAAAGVASLSSYDVLIELLEAPERRLRMAELARRVVLSRSGLTRLVDRLEDEGLLTRERTAEDRRGAYAVLTDAGYQTVRRAWPVYARSIQMRFAALLPADDARILTALLERMLNGGEARDGADTPVE
jgi:DNA-binding MarR family transcriptional regulator